MACLDTVVPFDEYIKLCHWHPPMVLWWRCVWVCVGATASLNQRAITYLDAHSRDRELINHTSACNFGKCLAMFPLVILALGETDKNKVQYGIEENWIISSWFWIQSRICRLMGPLPNNENNLGFTTDPNEGLSLQFAGSPMIVWAVLLFPTTIKLHACLGSPVMDWWPVCTRAEHHNTIKVKSRNYSEWMEKKKEKMWWLKIKPGVSVCNGQFGQ